MRLISSDSRFLRLQEFKDDPDFSPDKFPVMTTERCAQLMVVGMANRLDEIWISENPTLLMVYTDQYFPNFYRWYVSLNKFVLICKTAIVHQVIF